MKAVVGGDGEGAESQGTGGHGAWEGREEWSCDTVERGLRRSD